MGGKTRPPYPAEYRARITELARAGRNPEDLAKEFEPSGQTIRNWLRQDDLDSGRRKDGLTTAEREELVKLRRENRRLREEREILAKAAAWWLGKPVRFHPELRVDERLPGTLPHCYDESATGCFPQWLLRVARSHALCSCAG